MGVDHTNVATRSGRSSVRITSTKSYNHGVFILDLGHMPGGICGIWPAFWMTGPDWPDYGEVDIIEGVNSQDTNSMTLHTAAGCAITNNKQNSGTMTGSNCDINAAGQATNAGCQINDPSTNSFGTGFNAQGRGVYATGWTSQAFRVWFFPRGSIPSDIRSGNPEPAGWGTPTVVFSGSCDIDTHFQNQRIVSCADDLRFASPNIYQVFDTTFCGDWAGGVWSTDTVCSPLTSTCNAFVQNNPSAFVNAYWSVNFLKVYQDNETASLPASSTAPAASTSLKKTESVTAASTQEVSTTQTTPHAGSFTRTHKHTTHGPPSPAGAAIGKQSKIAAGVSTVFDGPDAKAAPTEVFSQPTPLPVVSLTSTTTSTLTAPAGAVLTETSTIFDAATSTTKAGNYVTVSALDVGDFSISSELQTAGVPVPQEKKRHVHRHTIRRNERRRHRVQ